MQNEKAKYQLLLERLAKDPALKEKALSATPEEFLSLCHENGLKTLNPENAKELQKWLKATFAQPLGEVSDEQLAAVAGGDCPIFGDVC